jgi:hypothetical protein
VSTRLEISHKSRTGKSGVPSIYEGFGAIEWLAGVGFLVKGVLYMVIARPIQARRANAYFCFSTTTRPAAFR